MNLTRNKLLVFIKNREFEVITGIGGVAALWSFVFDNEASFYTGIAFASLGLISIGMRHHLQKKDNEQTLSFVENFAEGSETPRSQPCTQNKFVTVEQS